ncbi:protein peste-like [Teleopsis dalmanni]|uniref:protein peste-like n=1 Tax=Teleopsis dalmanni TaxID=139649 RepID=UPI0018CFC77F|nr:protein peste-like [Teleopsis dalmanni]
MPKKTSAFKRWRQSHRKLIMGIIGFSLGIFGVLCGMFWEQIFNYIMEKELILRPGSRIYESWKKPPLKLSLDIYMFNWTNPEEFRNSTAKPILQQLGPYRFIEKPDKVDIVWNPENETVTYRRKSDFFFDAEGSNGSLDDEVTTLNAVALSAAAKAKHWNSVRRKMVDVGLKLYSQEISVIKSVDELLFTGYNDNMIDVARAVPIFGNEVEVPFDKFGWFYTRNGSADLTGVFNVYTGAGDITKLGQMHSWNYKSDTGFFDSYCGMTNGSAGEFHPPNLKEGGSVSLFTPDMCRTIPLDYVETVTIERIKGYKFAGGQRSIDNGSLYPENSCFCGGECVPSGVMNISSCRFGSPVFMSYPHFYMADEYYLNQVEGLEPNKENHEFYMILEPKTGVALEVAARFQVNMLVEPIHTVSLYENIPRIFFPLIWFEQKVRITPALASDIKTLPVILAVGQIFAGVCFAIGIILLCWYPLEELWRKHRPVDLKTRGHSENGKLTTISVGDESKTKLSTAEKEKLPDSSPLLEKEYKKPEIVTKSENINSVAMDTTCDENLFSKKEE